MVRMTTGRPPIVLPREPPLFSYSSTWRADLGQFPGTYSPLTDIPLALPVHDGVNRPPGLLAPPTITPKVAHLAADFEVRFRRAPNSLELSRLA
jgi:hypothetical protein